jgi:hypothetical protein
VTFDFKGPLPFVEVEEDEIRAEHMVYKSQTRVAFDKHDFAYDVSLAMHYADVLCGNEDLNEHLFEGPYFSFTLPFRKTEDDGKGKKFKLTLVEENVLEEDAPELKAENKAEAMHEKAIATARELLLMGLEVEKIAKATQLSREEVNSLAGQVL